MYMYHSSSLHRSLPVLFVSGLAGLEFYPVPVKLPWCHVAIDFIEHMTLISETGNRYILTISDYFTKYAEAIPLPIKCALPTEVASVLSRYNT